MVAHAGISPSLLACAVDLPADFRHADFLAFHRRDSQAVAEEVGEHRLRKGLLWAGQPACLSLRFADGQALAELACDGPAQASDDAALPRLLRHLLGLNQRIEEFEHAYRRHPQLGPLLAGQPGLRVPQAATPFEALSWAITGQQISVGAAVALRRRLILAAGLRHSGGLACYPDAARLAALDEETLRDAGFSQSKARTLRAVSALIVAGELPLDAWLATPPLPVEQLRERLLAVRGIGPWTVDYTLLRGFAWLDGSLHGDAAVRRRLQALLGSPTPPEPAAAQAWLAGFAPWRALAAAHLWAA
jgi:DNA-3-methyladenine glycosylase II